MKYIFFGTDEFSVYVLNELKKKGFIPNAVVTVPDTKSGRGQKIQMSSVKIWANTLGIRTIQPAELDVDKLLAEIGFRPDLFIVASYGKIIPNNVLEIPLKGALNVHPSLLPKYRGASPIESSILDDNKEIGVTIMLMDEKMDHGPILKQTKVSLDEWDSKLETEKMLAGMGGELLTEVIPLWMAKSITEVEQNHQESTFTKKIQKSDGLIDFLLIEKLIAKHLQNDRPEVNISTETQRSLFLKITALNPWPGTFFIMKHREIDMRVKILEAEWVQNEIKIKTVLPEARKPMNWDSFIDGFYRN